MTIAVTADMVIDTHRREKTEDNVEERMEAKLKLGYGIFKWLFISHSFPLFSFKGVHMPSALTTLSINL